MRLTTMSPVRTKFNSSPSDYNLDLNTVHVWRAYFMPCKVADGKYAVALSAPEIDRARRFIRKCDRDRYVFSHGVLRSILSEYMGCAPEEIEYEIKNHCKPRMANAGSGKIIQFNMSHSGEMTLIAVSRRTMIGIDVEYIRNIPDANQIVNSIFSIDERKYLNELPSTEFEKGFFDCWTAKEAFLKAIGKGLSYPLDEFSIVFSNGVPTGMKYVHGNSEDDNFWAIMGLSPGPGYSGALAIAEMRSVPKYYEYC